MPSAPALDPLLAPGRTLREVPGGLLSALPVGDQGAPYDRKAAVYDRVIGSRLYNRLLWGVERAEYREFAAEAVASGEGPFLDAGCGSAVFTAPVYESAPRPLVLCDRSLGMLDRAVERLHGAPTTCLQADIFDLPFAPQTFGTIGCFAMLHVLDDPWAALRSLAGCLAPGGRLFASMLVTDRSFGNRYAQLLHRSGELGPPRSSADLQAAAREVFAHAEVTRSGSMAWLRASAA